jgi:hypothetical protein
MRIFPLSQSEEFSKLFTDAIYLKAGDLMDDRTYIKWRSHRMLELFNSLETDIKNEIMHYIHSLAIGQHFEPQQTESQTIGSLQSISEIKAAIASAHHKNPEAARAVIEDFLLKLNAVAIAKPVLVKK